LLIGPEYGHWSLRSGRAWSSGWRVQRGPTCHGCWRNTPGRLRRALPDPWPTSGP